jgi:hypothetical protein
MATAERNTRLAEYHALNGHASPAAGCQKCAAQDRLQRTAAAALRAHRRQTARQIDLVLGKAVR